MSVSVSRPEAQAERHPRGSPRFRMPAPDSRVALAHTALRGAAQALRELDAWARSVVALAELPGEADGPPGPQPSPRNLPFECYPLPPGGPGLETGAAGRAFSRKAKVMNEEEIHVHIVKEKDRANYSMRYIDPMTGKVVKKSTGKAKRKDALMKAGEWENELREGRYSSPSKVTWEAFRRRYADEKLASLAPATKDRAENVFGLVEKILAPVRLRDVTAEKISFWQSKLREGGRSEQTIASYSRHLKAALRWAAGSPD